MASFVANQKCPFWSPSKILIYEVKLLKRKEAQIFILEIIIHEDFLLRSTQIDPKKQWSSKNKCSV